MPPAALIDFLTLGMFIIDQIVFPPSTNRPSIDDIPGGAGLWALLGARIFSPPPTLSKQLCFLLDAGSDFPEELLDVLGRWKTGLIVRRDEGRLTTRGWNSYEVGDRKFKYLSPKKRLEIMDYVDQGVEIPKVGSLHVICTSGRLRSVLLDIQRECSKSTTTTITTTGRPRVVFEPVPDGCGAEVREEMLGLLGEVDVISPNEMEMRAFFSEEEAGMEGVFDEKFYDMVESFALAMTKGSGSGHGGGGRGVVVRCGRHGSYTFSLRKGLGMWHPAYHSDQNKVVDPTGGGNTFLGAVCIALARGEDVFEAAVWGNVAASYAVEQIGMPQLADEDGNVWNGESVEERSKKYRARLESRA